MTFLGILRFLWELFKELHGTPEDQRRAKVEKIRAQFQKFEDAGDTTDLGDFS